MSTKDVQILLRTKHILVQDMPDDGLCFDEKGLGTLTTLDAKIPLQGLLFLPIYILADIFSNRPVDRSPRR
jgi:hypothetical protein